MFTKKHNVELPERETLAKKLWLRTDVIKHVEKIKKALDNYSEWSMPQLLYEFGMYHIDNTLSFSRTIGDAPSVDDINWLRNEFDKLRDELTDQGHLYIHYFLHLTQHYYRSLEDCDINLQCVFETVSAGLTIFMDMLYPVNSEQEKRLLEAKKIYIQRQIAAQVENSKDKKQNDGEVEDEFMLGQARYMLQAIHSLAAKIGIEQAKLMDFKPYIDESAKLKNYADEKETELSRTLMLYNYYLKNSKLSHANLVDRYTAQAVPPIKTYLALRKKGVISPMAENIGFLRSRLIKLDSQIIEETFSACSRTIRECYPIDGMEYGDFKQAIERLELAHFRIKNFEKGCVISALDFRKLCELAACIFIIARQFYRRNRKFYDYIIKDLERDDKGFRDLVNIIPNANFTIELDRLLRYFRGSLHSMRCLNPMPTILSCIRNVVIGRLNCILLPEYDENEERPKTVKEYNKLRHNFTMGLRLTTPKLPDIKEPGTPKNEEEYAQQTIDYIDGKRLTIPKAPR